MLVLAESRLTQPMAEDYGASMKRARYARKCRPAVPRELHRSLFPCLCLCDRTFNRNYFLLVLWSCFFLLLFLCSCVGLMVAHEQLATIYSSTVAHEEEYALSFL